MADEPSTGSMQWVIGGLVAAIAALGGVIAFLFKHYNSRAVEAEKQHQLVETTTATERTRWAEEKATWDAEREAERERERADSEKKHRELLERYEELSRADRQAHYEREEQIRREHAEMMEKLSVSQEKSSAAMVALLQKMHERFLGGKRRGG